MSLVGRGHGYTRFKDPSNMTLGISHKNINVETMLKKKRKSDRKWREYETFPINFNRWNGNMISGEIA